MIEDFELIDTVDHLAQVIAAFYTLYCAPPSLYLDLEGHDLCRDGRISLISVFAEPLKKTFLIDVQVLGELAFTTSSTTSENRTLQSLLQDASIPKVLFDCRNDTDALYNIYKVDMKGVIDLQLMELATRKGHKRFVNGLARTIRDYAELSPEDLEIWTNTKTSVKAKFFNNYDLEEGVEPLTESAFDQRPLPSELLRYSVQDVTLLPQLWRIFDAKLTPKWRKKVDEEVFWRVQLSRQAVYYGKNGKTATMGPW
ncbi:hypothetical protein FRB94_003584 [Tulasnella sp. JGI-2019a]|nr:hypothetical protein FRB93_002585 [Tulasnella sp. JGI-2019a]KAG9013144.1 hypothetical protein FRB94_003584 [Tulasnella sp. JGI-2019a]KAG9032179.1 hypothetical protein FRB95_001806 [Tulasnella sp. JGI-2019a]